MTSGTKIETIIDALYDLFTRAGTLQSILDPARGNLLRLSAASASEQAFKILLKHQNREVSQYTISVFIARSSSVVSFLYTANSPDRTDIYVNRGRLVLKAGIPFTTADNTEYTIQLTI